MNSFEECYLFLPNLASLRLGARNIRIRESLTSGQFAQAAQTLSYSNRKSTKFKKFDLTILRVLRDLRGEIRFSGRSYNLGSLSQTICASGENFNCSNTKPGLIGRAQRGHDGPGEKFHGAQRFGEGEVAEGELADEVIGGGIVYL